MVSTPTGREVAFAHPSATFGSISLRVCGAQSSTVVALDYPQPKDNTTAPYLQFETPEDSL